MDTYSLWLATFSLIFLAFKFITRKRKKEDECD